MMALLLILHIIVCALLMIIVLIQSGRGGGLVEAFSGMESMFGAKTSAVMTKATTVLSIMFFLTCLSLAALSARQSKSLMRNLNAISAPMPAGQAPEAATQAPVEGSAQTEPIPDKVEK